jgi:hypothetical protein
MVGIVGEDIVGLQGLIAEAATPNTNEQLSDFLAKDILYWRLEYDVVSAAIFDGIGELVHLDDKSQIQSGAWCMVHGAWYYYDMLL